MRPAVKLLLNQSLQQQVKAILKRSGGSLYLPSPSTCFQDSEGTTPCAVDDPVGLLLDTGQGGLSNLGPELVTNGDFSNGTTGWNVASVSASIVNGMLEVTVPASSFSRATQTINLTVGKSYVFTATLKKGTSPQASVANMTPVFSFVTTDVNGITKTQIFTATGVTSEIRLSGDSTGTTGGASYYDNVSVRELPGNHAIQSTTGFKPILRGKVKNWLVNTATLSTQTVSVAASGVTWTLQFKGTGSIAISGGYTGNLAGTGASNLVSLPFTTNAATNLTFTVTGSVTEAQLELGSVVNTYIASGAKPKSSSYGPYWLDFDGVDYVLTISNLATFTSATVIKSQKDIGQTTLTAQNISAGYSYNQARSNGLILIQGTVNNSDVLKLQKYINRLAGI